ncbi:MAG: hypothetical protein HKN67_06290 [Saprospiraceae bacterium]|nr:hypothetical protein [Saprospiraceae bacterium]
MDKNKITQEIREVFGISLFFYIIFLIFQIYKKITLVEYAIEYTAFGSALIGALVIGKVVFLVDKLSFTRRMDNGPKIYGVVYRSLIYLLGFTVFTIIEHFIKEIISGSGFGISLTHGLEHIFSLEYAGKSLFSFITFIFFNAYWAIRNHIGARELYILFFSKERDQ